MQIKTILGALIGLQLTCSFASPADENNLKNGVKKYLEGQESTKHLVENDNPIIIVMQPKISNSSTCFVRSSECRAEFSYKNFSCMASTNIVLRDNKVLVPLFSDGKKILMPEDREPIEKLSGGFSYRSKPLPKAKRLPANPRIVKNKETAKQLALSECRDIINRYVETYTRCED